LDALNISSRNREFVEEQIAEYLKEGKLSVWSDENLRKMSKHVVDILGVRSRVENFVSSVTDNVELSKKLADIIKQFAVDASDEVSLAISQCFMKDLSVGQDEQEFRERIYRQWIDFVQDGGLK
jgi:hypothetical protein